MSDDSFSPKEVVSIFGQCSKNGVPGLIVFGVFALAMGAYYIFQSAKKFEKQVDQAETDTATSGSGAQDVLSETDAVGENFLNP